MLLLLLLLKQNSKTKRLETPFKQQQQKYRAKINDKSQSSPLLFVRHFRHVDSNQVKNEQLSTNRQTKTHTGNQGS